MKTIISIVIMAILGVTACQTEQSNTNVLSEEQKQKIIIEIDSLWNYSGQGIENLDAHQAFSVCTPDAKYIRDAHLYDNIKTAEDQYAEWFSNAPQTNSKFTMDPVFHDVITKDVVITTAIAHLAQLDTDNQEIGSLDAGYTFVWNLLNDEWKVIIMHISFPNN